MNLNEASTTCPRISHPVPLLIRALFQKGNPQRCERPSAQSQDPTTNFLTAAFTPNIGTEITATSGRPAFRLIHVKQFSALMLTTRSQRVPYCSSQPPRISSGLSAHVLDVDFNSVNCLIISIS